jgi:glutathione S-transferase
MTHDLILHYAPDNASLCVRLLLAEMAIPYQTVLVDRAAKAQRSEAYLALNPNGWIPTLETSDGPIFETAAILLWLADQKPGSVFPAPDDAQRGQALSQLFWLTNTVHPALRMMFYPDAYTATDPEALRQQTHQRLLGYFALLDARWDQVSCPVLACYAAPMLRWCALYGGDTAWFDLSKYASLEAFTESFEKRSTTLEVCALEGLGPTPFSKPQLPSPPEGSAT